MKLSKDHLNFCKHDATSAASLSARSTVANIRPHFESTRMSLEVSSMIELYVAHGS